jgi:hypothetical protein
VKFPDLKNPKQNQQAAKHRLHQELRNIDGTVLWYAKAAVDDIGNYGSVLRKHYWNKPVLQPSMTFIDKHAPKSPRKLKAMWTPEGYTLFWTAPKGKTWKDEATTYVVYRFTKGEKVNLDDASKMVAVTTKTFYKLPYDDGKLKYTYIVTALNRIHNESKPAKKKIKL